MLVNQTEAIVKDVYDEIVNGFPNYCKCDRCREDVFCLALNKLPAKYTTNSGKKAYTSLLENEQQFKVEVMRVLITAIQIVENNPRCKM